MSLKSKRMAAVGLAAAMMLAACGGGGSDTKSSDGLEPLVGVIGPKSGAAQFYWTEMTRGLELAAPDMKEQYGVTFKLVEADDKGDPAVAARAVQKLLNTDKVDAIFGPSQSGPSLQVAETIQRTGRPWLVAIAAADEIVDPKASPNWGFRTNNNNTDAINVSGSYLWNSADSKVGIVYASDAYGQSNHDLLAAYAKDKGLSLTASEVIQPGATDVSPALQRMKSKGVNTVFIAVSTGADTAAIVKGMKQVGLKPERTLATATITAGFTDLTSKDDWGSIVFIEPRDLTGPTFMPIVERYEKKYGEKPASQVAVYTTYTAAMLYAKAVAEVGDASKWDDIRTAIEGTDKIDIFGRTFESPFGSDDHELYEDDASSWFVIGFDDKGELRTVGPASS